jgi:large subunit ribosomal protein L25
MSEQLTLSAETRDRAGKGASRHLRREGRVPAVVYGNNEEALSIHVEEKALVRALSGGHFMNSVVMIDAGAAPVRTLPKDVQFHPVTDRPLHVDFLRISEHAKVHVDVPIHFVDEDKSKGIKRGGVLNQVRHDLELICDAAEIPEEIVISLAGLDIGDSLHFSAVVLPKGVESAITDRDFTIATIVPSSGVQSEASDAAADAGEAPDAADVPLVGEEGEGEAEEGTSE